MPFTVFTTQRHDVKKGLDNSVCFQEVDLHLLGRYSSDTVWHCRSPFWEPLILFVVTLWRYFIILGRNTHFYLRSSSSVHDMVHKSVEPS